MIVSHITDVSRQRNDIKGIRLSNRVRVFFCANRGDAEEVAKKPSVADRGEVWELPFPRSEEAEYFSYPLLRRALPFSVNLECQWESQRVTCF